MAAQTQKPHAYFIGPKVLYRATTMDPKTAFYNRFKQDIASLEGLIERLPQVVLWERPEAIDHALARVTQLQNEVADAAEFTPAYDRRQYAETLKTVQEKLTNTINEISPRKRFQFKKSKLATQHVDMGAAENDPRLQPGSQSLNSHVPTPQVPIADDEDDLEDEAADSVPELKSSSRPGSGKDYNKEMARTDDPVRRPSFSNASGINIYGQRDMHISLPMSASAATTAGRVTDITGCLLDMSKPTEGATAFPGLALKNIKGSLIIAGRVDGAVHITGLTDSIVVVAARQVRIHECRDVDFYLHCTSHPIIEDCTGMRFAPFPEHYYTDLDDPTKNQWNQVDDFKWLKAGPSPNWTILSEASRLDGEVWTKVVPHIVGYSVQDSLKRAGLPRTVTTS